MLTKNMLDEVVIYTDGACRGNPGIGGWGAILIFKHYEKKIFGACENTTNNRMELTAAIEAIKQLKRSCLVNIYTDSIYLKNGIDQWIKIWLKKGWRTSNSKGVKNQDLWQDLLLVSKKHNIKYHWVAGHSNIPGNEEADKLANIAINNALQNREN